MEPRLLARRFDTERPQLRAVATRLLGSDADADDVVQEAWLRLARADVERIDNLAAWLTTVVSRLCLDRLRARRRPGRRERLVVEAWLRAVRDGDLTALLGLLDDDAVLRADYGSGAETVRGGARIARRATGFGRLAAGSTLVLAGGRPAVLSVVGGRAVSLMAFEIRDGRVVGLDVLADPGRLAGTAPPAEVPDDDGEPPSRDA